MVEPVALSDYAKLRDAAQGTKETHKPIEYGSGGGDNGGMDPEVAVLKHRADASDQRMARIEDKLDVLIDRTSKMATVNGLWGMVATVVGLCAASVGVIVAILTWLQGFHH